MLNRLVGGTILAHTESVVGPDELHGHAHQGGQTNSGLHVVGEHEERTASGDDTTMEHHADTHVCHGQFTHACLEEGSREVAMYHAGGLLQETVGLIGVGEVGGCANHVGHLLSQFRETSGTCGTCCAAWLLHDLGPVHLGCFATEPFLHLGSLLRILLLPFSLFCATSGYYLAKLCLTVCIELLYIIKYHEGILGVSAQVLDGVYIGIATQGSTMGLDATLIAGTVLLQRAFAHHGLTDDESGAVLLLQGSIESLAYLVHVVAVDFDDIPVPSLVLSLCVLAHHYATLSGELDVV